MPCGRAAGVSRPRQRTLSASVLAAIAAGGTVGTGARHGVALLLPVPSTTAFPWPTFWTNTAGSFLLGLILPLLLERLPAARHLRLFLATGLLGSFSTFSTFALEIDLLARGGRPGLAAAYALTTVAAGLGAVSIGIAAARTLPLYAARQRSRR